MRHHRGATLGLGSGRRITLIERNRVLLVVKLFPWSLLWLNGAYILTRLAAGLWAGFATGGNCAITRDCGETNGSNGIHAGNLIGAAVDSVHVAEAPDLLIDPPPETHSDAPADSRAIVETPNLPTGDLGASSLTRSPSGPSETT